MSRLTRQQANLLLADGVQADVRDSAEVLALLERQFEAALRHRSSELTGLAEQLAPLLDAMEARRQQRVSLVRALRRVRWPLPGPTWKAPCRPARRPPPATVACWRNSTP